jgi:hypothetical protein
MRPAKTDAYLHGSALLTVTYSNSLYSALPCLEDGTFPCNVVVTKATAHQASQGKIIFFCRERDNAIVTRVTNVTLAIFHQ